MNKNIKPQFPVLRDFPWSQSKASCLAFCYPRRGQPFVLKGQVDLVSKFLELNGQPIVAHYRIYDQHKATRHSIRVYGLIPHYQAVITHPMRHNPQTGERGDHQRCYIILRRDNTVISCKPVRYIPRKWLKDLNVFASKNASSIPLVPLNMKPVVPPPPPKPEPTEEEKQMAAAIAKSKNIMDSVLREFGAIPGDEPVDVYEVDLATLEAMVNGGETSNTNENQ